MNHDEATRIHREDLAAAVKGFSKLPRNAPRIDRLRHIVETCSAARTEGVLIDLFTASMLVQIHDKLSPEHQAKFLAMPIRRMVDIGWKLASGKKS